MRQPALRHPLWITQIFVDIDWRLVMNAVRRKYAENVTFDLHLAVRFHGYTIGTITFPHHGHIACRLPVETIDRDTVSMTLFCTSDGAFSEHVQKNLPALLREWRVKPFCLYFVGYQAGPGRVVMGLSGHHTSIGQTNEATFAVSALSPMKYYGIQLLRNPETQEIYDAAGPLGRYNAKYGVIVTSLE